MHQSTAYLVRVVRAILCVAIINVVALGLIQAQGIALPGLLDTNFSPVVRPLGARSITSQSDGKILLAGHFTTTPGSLERHALIRFHPNGSEDAQFASTPQDPS